MSIEYVASRDDPTNIRATEHPGSYRITMQNQKPDGRVHPFTQFCLWEIRSAKSSFNLRSAIDLFGDAAHDVPRGNASDPQKNAEAGGISLTLRKNAEESTCEVKEVSRK